MAERFNPPHPKFWLLFLFVCVSFGLTIAPIAWVEVHARVRRKALDLGRLGLAGLATAALVALFLLQGVWFAGVVKTSSYEGGLVELQRALFRLATSKNLSAFVGLSLLWPLTLGLAALLRARVIPAGGRLLLHLMFFPLVTFEAVLGWGIDTVDARLFGLPEAVQAGGAPRQEQEAERDDDERLRTAGG